MKKNKAFILIIFTLFIITSCKKDDMFNKITTAPNVFVAVVPTFSHGGGLYHPGLALTISSYENGATIRYTLDGTDPKTSGTAIDTINDPPSVTLTINNHTTVKAFAFMTGVRDSDFYSGVVSNHYEMHHAAIPVVAPGTMPGPETYITEVTGVAITSATTDPVRIYYTIDGTLPDHNPVTGNPIGTTLEYTGIPQTFTQNRVVRAYAVSDVVPKYLKSPVSTMEYRIRVATPTINVVGGEKNNTINVTIATTTPGSSLKYTSDDTDPATSGSATTIAASNHTFDITQNDPTLLTIYKLRVIALKPNCDNSLEATVTYIFKCAAPTMNPVVVTQYDDFPFTFPAPVTTGATVRYELREGMDPPDPIDGVSPTVPVMVTKNDTRIRAIAFKPGYLASEPLNRTYTLRVRNLTITPASSTYNNDQTLSIAMNPPITNGDVRIRYTIAYGANPTNPPTEAHDLYTAPFLVTRDDTRIRARAFKDNYVPSDTTGIRTIRLQVAEPTASHIAGSYDDPIDVTLSTITNDTAFPLATVSIYYTINEPGDPTTSSTLYTGAAIPITQNTILKARAFKNNYQDSPIMTRTYGIKVKPVTFSPGVGFGYIILTDTLEFSSTTPGATFRYTTDGSEPDGTSTEYVGPITVPASAVTTYKIKAFKAGYDASDTTTITVTSDAVNYDLSSP